jgi:hypothetical protein
MKKYEEKKEKLRKVIPLQKVQDYFGKWISDGFHRITSSELYEIVKDPTKRARPVKKEGKETVFELRKKRRKIVVCTSRSEYINSMKVFDQGWILIIDNYSQAILFFPPMNRTSTFLERMDERIRACIDLVDHWPCCAACNHELRMCYDKERSLQNGFDPFIIWFKCPQCKFHEKNEHHSLFSLFEIQGLSKHNRRVLLNPFVTLNKRRQKNPNSLPRRFIRWCTINGVPIPRLTVYNDLKYEKFNVYSDGNHIIPLDEEPPPFTPDPSY